MVFVFYNSFFPFHSPYVLAMCIHRIFKRALRYHAMARYNVGDVVFGNCRSHCYRFGVHHPCDFLVRNDRTFRNSRQGSPNANSELCAFHEDANQARLTVDGVEDLLDDSPRPVSVLPRSTQRPHRLQIFDSFRLIVVVDEDQIRYGFVGVGHGDQALAEWCLMERIQQLERHAIPLVLLHRHASKRCYNHDETFEESWTQMRSTNVSKNGRQKKKHRSSMLVGTGTRKLTTSTCFYQLTIYLIAIRQFRHVVQERRRDITAHAQNPLFNILTKSRPRYPFSVTLRNITVTFKL